ncbi:MAG: aromatic amino acid lyase [Chloroflexota bacterium]
MRRANGGPNAHGEGRANTAEQAALLLDGESLSTIELLAVARRGRRVALAPSARARVEASAATVADLVRGGKVVYGINTGFGKLYDVVIPPEELRQLQINLVRSHSVGVGPLLPPDAVRGSILLRANALAKGYSGISEGTLQALMDLLNADILPVVPAQGSVGASGDLAPSAHIALALIGEGEAHYKGQLMPAARALAEARLAPANLGPKEGLALLNGTATMTAIGGLALADAAVLAKAADIAAALSFEAIHADPHVLDPRVHRLRPHRGQIQSAANLRALLAGSSIYDRAACAVQDP